MKEFWLVFINIDGFVCLVRCTIPLQKFLFSTQKRTTGVQFFRDEKEISLAMVFALSNLVMFAICFYKHSSRSLVGSIDYSCYVDGRGEMCC